MKPRLLDFLLCPKYRTELKLVAWNFRPVFLSQAHRKLAEEMRIEPEKITKDVFEGVLVNHEHKLIYPIIDGVPRLLLFASSAMRTFFAKHKARLTAELPGYALPNFDVLESEVRAANAFRNQIFAGDSEPSIKEKAEREIVQKSLGNMLGANNAGLRGHSLLDVGLGFGGIASTFAQEQNCEIIGIDASHLVDTVQKKACSYPFFHLVQASIMAPVFKLQGFDLTYSVGALNRLYAPKVGMAKMSEMTKRQGRLSVWFDDDQSEQWTRSRRLMVSAESWLRPVISRLPGSFRTYAALGCMPLYLMHERLFEEQYAAAGLLRNIRGAMALAEKRLEPHLNQTLGGAQVKGWFAEEGYQELRLRTPERQSWVRVGLWNCSGVEGVRA